MHLLLLHDEQQTPQKNLGDSETNIGSHQHFLLKKTFKTRLGDFNLRKIVDKKKMGQSSLALVFLRLQISPHILSNSRDESSQNKKKKCSTHLAQPDLTAKTWNFTNFTKKLAQLFGPPNTSSVAELALKRAEGSSQNPHTRTPRSLWSRSPRCWQTTQNPKSPSPELLEPREPREKWGDTQYPLVN